MPSIDLFAIAKFSMKLLFVFGFISFITLIVLPYGINLINQNFNFSNIGVSLPSDVAWLGVGGWINSIFTSWVAWQVIYLNALIFNWWFNLVDRIHSKISSL